MRVLLVRHGESAANADKSLHGKMADHDIPLSDRGLLQASEAGKFINSFLNERLESKTVWVSDAVPYVKEMPARVRLWNSPYRRTRQTAKNILGQVSPQKFVIDQRENNRLCEQQFGLFDGYPDEEWETVFPEEGRHYNLCKEHNGLYWARMPLGESRFDVANRVYESFGTFHRDNEKHGINTIIVICHGVTLRAFAQEWLHLSPEWFNEEPNPDNCWVRYLSEGEDDNNGVPGDKWIDHGYVFTGAGNAELWPKQRLHKPASPCKRECGRVDGACPTCKRTTEEIAAWKSMTTQEQSRVMADITIR